MQTIALLLPSLEHGGAEKVFVEMASYLADEGKDVVLVSLDRYGELITRIPDNLDVIYLDEGLRVRGFIKRLFQWVRLRRFIENRNITNVVSTLTGMNIFTLSCFLLNKKVQLTVREANSLENISSYFMLVFAYLLYPRANKIICTSEHGRAQLLKWRRIKKDSVYFLPNPVDMERIRRCAKKNGEHSESGSSGDYNVVTVGRCVKQKGFDVLIKALAIARMKHDIHLVIVGDGPERTYLEAEIQRLGLEDAVCLAGYQSNPYPYVKNADLFVLSSRWEGYVNVVVEAMVLGVDVVATDCKSGPGNLLHEALNYPLVPVDSPELLAEEIIARLLHPRDTTRFDGLLQTHQLSYAVKRYLNEE